MKNHIRHSFLLGLMIITAFFSLFPTPTSAASYTTYLTPASGVTQPGYTFLISVDSSVGYAGIWGNSGVTGSLNFPANLLQVVSISSAGSPFPTRTATPNNTTGVITFNQSANWWQGVNDQTIHLLTITFRAVTNGTANVNFGTVRYYAGYPSAPVSTATTSGGTYTISTPAPPPPPNC